jgi:iron complex outermembrane recepter protein
MRTLASLRRNAFLCGSGLVALAFATPAAAQTAGAQDVAAQQEAADAQTAAAPAGEAPAEENEVVVTAERRNQNLQDVPISATVLNAADLTRRGVGNIADIQQVAPSVAINTFNRSTFINIRGVGIAQSAPTSNPGVAYYVDGQLYPHEQFIGQSFYDIGSIEVLRGPQGTLTGQNSTGGAIYVRTPEPDYHDFSGYGDVTVGEYDAVRVMAALNVPISDNVAFRVSGVRDRRDSYTRNIGRAEIQPGNVDLLAGRFNLAVRSSDNRIRLNLRFDAFDSDSFNNAVKRRNDTVSTDPFVIEEDANSFQNQSGYRLSGEARIEVLHDVDARFIFSWQDLDTIDQTDGDRTATAPPRPPANAVGRISRVSTEFGTLTGELNLISTGGGPFNWVVGGFYLDETIDVLSLRDNNNTREFVSSTSTFQTRAENITKSVFGQFNWFVAPQLELIAGGRFSNDTQIYNRLIPAGAPPPPNVSRIGVQESNKVTGRLGLTYHATDDTMLYTTLSRGYKAGGVNLTIGVPNFGPETNTVVEAGVKTALFDRHLRVNLSGFYSDYQDIQLSSLNGGLPVTQNAASGMIYGAELEVTGRFGGLSLNAGLGWLHGEFSSDTCITDTNAAGTDPGCPTNLRFVPEGRRLPFAPRWTINAGVQYQIDLSESVTLTPRAQWSHLSAQVATPFPSQNTVVPGRDVVDLRLALEISRRYRLEGFVTNVFDETYIASQIQNSSSADGGMIFGAPRQFGMRATVNF